MISSTVMRGLRLPKGSWNTICISARSGRICPVRKPWMSRPRKMIGPSDEISRIMASASVVLPEPDSPTMPTVSPARTVSVAAFTALTWPTVRFSSPRWIGNQIRSASVARDLLGVVAAPARARPSISADSSIRV